MKKEMTDEQAVADMRQRGQQGFTTLHRKYEGRLKAYLIKRYNLNISKDEDDIKEIIHCTFIRFYKTIHKFREEAGVFTWLTRLASNETSEHFKKKERKPPEDTKIPSDICFEPNIEKDLCYERCMRSIFAKFKYSSYTNCINVLTFLAQELSIKEIAIKIGRTPNATAVFIASCRKKLSKHADVKHCWEECKKLSKFGRRK